MNKETAMAVLGGFLIGVPVGYFLKKAIDKARYEVENAHSAAYGFEQFEEDEHNTDQWEGFVQDSDPNDKDKESIRYEDIPDQEEGEDLNLDENYAKFAVDYEHPTEDDENKEPYVISQEQFDEEHNEYKKTTLIYLSGDDTLISEDEEVLSANDLIGLKSVAYLKMVAKDYSSDDILTFSVNVRNDSLGEDFEVVWSDMSYGRDYLGIFD